MRIASLAAIAALVLLPASVFAQSAAPSTPSAAAPSASAPAAKPEITPEMKARFEKFRAACGADLQTHCATVARGTDGARGEMRQCIDTHKAKFSAGCQAAIIERDAARDARKASQGEKPKT